MSTGRFVWFDLMTPDLAAARAFYGALFGWQFRDHDGHYSLIFDDEGRGLGGAMQTEEDQPPTWLPYVSTDDAGATAAAIQAGGGQIFVDKTAPGVGRFLIFSDPDGALAATIQLEDERVPYPREKNAAHLCWSELHAPDPQRAFAFYASLFGWTPEAWGSDYLLITQEHAGGVLKAQPGNPPMWLVYVNSLDTDATAAKVLALGGKVYAEPMDMPGVGRFAVFGDPTGVVFAVMATRRPA